MKKTLLHLMLLLIVSCANNEKATTTKTYSEDTNRAFEMIERGGSYYLKKAPTDKAPPQIELPAQAQRKKAVAKIKPAHEEIIIDEKIAQPTPALGNTQSTSKADERLIEINQNLAFYCMKNRKNPAYGGDEARCMKHVDRVMNTCKQQHRIVNSKLLTCIQKKLKGKK